ncbi:hypothetical protein TNCV_1667941 [Trichonephila clavipes]|nr:hypothetical protein TNCV_1667941 [Trichonephila clavipes]
MRQIAAKLPWDLSTVVRTLKRFSETNFITDRGRLGRPRKTSLREDRTVRGRMLEIGLRGCKARPKPLLTEFQRKRRLTWASEHSLWTIKDWEKSLVYADKPQTLDYLEDNIHLVIADIRPQMLEKVIENWTSRLDYIRASRGSPMPEVIF